VPAASSPVADPRRSADGSAGGHALACRVAAGDDERARHFEIRRAVFCAEQGMFGGEDDRDERDAAGATLHAVGVEDGIIGGTVRLYPLDADHRQWQGDRLAVLPPFRRTSLGGELVRFAVRTAGAAGGARMVAMIQVPNVRFFVSLGWSLDGAVVAFHGRDHQPMAIPLSPGRGG
jgi:putative N-acetyltransferase (TIGR04045 family)